MWWGVLENIRENTFSFISVRRDYTPHKRRAACYHAAQVKGQNALENVFCHYPNETTEHILYNFILTYSLRFRMLSRGTSEGAEV